MKQFFTAAALNIFRKDEEYNDKEARKGKLVKVVRFERKFMDGGHLKMFWQTLASFFVIFNCF